MHKIILNENNSSLILEEAKQSILHENLYKRKKPSSTNTDAFKITGEDINASGGCECFSLYFKNVDISILPKCSNYWSRLIFSMIFPTVSIGAIVAQVIAYPIGNVWHFFVPLKNILLPFSLG